MLRFQHQAYLGFLVVIVLLGVLFVLFLIQRKKKMKALGDSNLIELLIPSYSAVLSKLKFASLLLALFFGIIALANLQKSGESEKVTQEGIDVVIALDVSNSMYAQDLQPSRLERAKLLTTKLVEKLSENRMALILFAGRPYISVPLTSDIEALKMNLSIASPDQIPTQGTVIGDALQMASQTFNTKDAKHKAIILISDGEDHEEKAISEAKKLADKGIILCTVGVGSEDGSKIPIPGSQDFKKDRDGQEVISKMNEDELQKIADAGKGLYVRLDNIGSVVNELDNRLAQLGKSNLGDSRFMNYTSYFQYFLAISLLLMLIEFFIPGRRAKKRLHTAFHLLLLLLLPQFLSAQTENKNIYRGNVFYKKGDYQKAITEYQKSLDKKEKISNRTAKFNMGNALFQSKNNEQALQQYEQVGAKAEDNKLSAASYHNAGNVRATEQKWQEAISYYKASLKKNPNSPETKYNLAYAQKKLQEQKNKDKDKKDDKNKDQNKDQDKQQQPQKPDDKKENGQPKEDKGKEEEKKTQRPQPQPSKLSKDQADKLLDALGREEQKIKDKKEKGKASGRILDKDW